HLLGRTAGADADPFPTRLLEWDATDRGLRLVLDCRLAARVPRPPHPTEKPGLDRLLELVVGPGLGGVLAHERLRAREHRRVDRFRHGGYRAGQLLLRRARLPRLARRCSAGRDRRAPRDLSRA